MNKTKDKEKLLQTILNRKKMVYVGGGRFMRLTTVWKRYEHDIIYNVFPNPYTLVELGGVNSQKIVNIGDKVIKKLSENFDIRPPQWSRQHGIFDMAKRFAMSKTPNDVYPMRVSPLHYASLYRSDFITERKLLDWDDVLNRFEEVDWDMDLDFRRLMVQIETENYFGMGFSEILHSQYLNESELIALHDIVKKWLSANETQKIYKNINKMELHNLKYLCNGQCFKEIMGEYT